MIVTFANQKGGVGKTTLLLLFANYLVELGRMPLVVDTDYQRSIFVLRDEDISLYPGQDLPYEVVECDLQDPSQVLSYLEELRSDKDFILIDTPGNLTENGLPQVFALSDYIVVPYQYERKCLDSTGTFVSAINQINERLRSRSHPTPKLIFAPNRIKMNEGLKSEKEIWEETDKVLKNFGEILPIIKDLTTHKRVNTLFMSKEQRISAKQSLDSLYQILYPKISSSN